MQKQPLLLLLLGFISGILVQEFANLSVIVLGIILIISLLTAIIFFTKNIYFLRYKTLIFVFIAFCLGIFLHYFQNQIPKFPTLQKEETVIFKLDKKLKSNEKNRKYEVEVWKSASNKIADSKSFKSILIIPKSEPELDFLHFYQTTAFVSKVDGPQHDYQFDYQKYLQRKGVFHQIYLPKGFKQSEKKSLNFLEFIKQNRLELLQKIDHTSLSTDTKELIKGIILADRTEMNSETVADFQKTGLVHILAISGTHIAIIFGLFYFIFIKIFPFQWRKYAIISSIIFIWMFAVFIGLGNSVVRACIMLTVYFTYTILQRKSDFMHSISLAAILILLFNVNQLFDVGFQLSFSAVLGIFWFNQPILKWFPKNRNKLVTLFKNIFSVTTAAQLGTLPLVLFYFHQYSYISIFANLLILPAVEFLIIGALFITLLIAVGLPVSYLFKLFDIVVNAILQIIHWLSNFEFFMVERIAMNMIEVIILFVILYFLRFVFVKFNLKNILNLSYCLVLFIAVRLGFHFYYEDKSEIIGHQFFKNQIVSSKEKGKVLFFMKEDVDEKKVVQYLIHPYTTSVRTENFEIKKVSDDQNFIEFEGFKYEIK